MSFQAYLDNVEEKTGLTPRQFIELAHEKGLDAPGTKAAAIWAWLKEDYDIGRGHAQAIAHVILKGPEINDMHVGTTGSHSDKTATLWLEGRDSNPTRSS